ncbi:E3 ubiquitin-protein ligase RNF4-like isoform X2 [Hydra vulgaris]|uniref:E3 ubiquitin-protein ligase RNF4-like isoform X2 n=1 Tax=Hydra vulgaris TaxID=6087 RepID=A0ABM4B3U1_HYDVU
MSAKPFTITKSKKKKEETLYCPELETRQTSLYKELGQDVIDENVSNSKIDLPEPKPMFNNSQEQDSNSSNNINDYEDKRESKKKKKKKKHSEDIIVIHTNGDENDEDDSLRNRRKSFRKRKSDSISSKKTSVTCSVCLDNLDQIISDGRKLTSTICGHIFCDQCIFKALETIQSCPTCRMMLKKKQLRPIFL